MPKTFKKLPKWLILLAALIMVALLGYVDYLTGDYSMLIFYVLPLTMVAWLLGRWGVLIVSVAAGSARFISDSISYSGTGVRYWNSLQDMLFLLLMGLLVSTVKKLLTEDQNPPDR